MAQSAAGPEPIHILTNASQTRAATPAVRIKVYKGVRPKKLRDLPWLRSHIAEGPPSSPPGGQEGVAFVVLPRTPCPAMVALARLARAAITSAQLADHAGRLSVLEWRSGDDAARTMDANLWLSFTASALRTYKFRVVLVAEAPAPGERFRHSFCDALVAPTSEAIALFGRTLGRHLGTPPRAEPAAPALTSTAQ